MLNTTLYPKQFSLNNFTTVLTSRKGRWQRNITQLSKNSVLVHLATVSSKSPALGMYRQFQRLQMRNSKGIDDYKENKRTNKNTTKQTRGKTMNKEAGREINKCSGRIGN